MNTIYLVNFEGETFQVVRDFAGLDIIGSDTPKSNRLYNYLFDRLENGETLLKLARELGC